METEKISAAIIGLGRIASLLEDDRLREKPCTHAGAIAANPELRLAAGCDLDGERRELFALRWGVPVYASAEEMILREKPRLLVVATHPDSHWHYCRMAACMGVAAVICEKPLADERRDARNIAALHGSGKIKIITNHERRYSADYLRAKEIIEREELGPLLSVRAVLYMGKNKRLLDILWHDGTHLADALMFLTASVLRARRTWGAPLKAREGTAWLEARLKPESPPEPPSARGTKKKVIPVVIELGAGRDHLIFEMEFSCARGRLRTGNGVFEVWESGESPYAENFRSLKQRVSGFEGPTGYFANMISDAAACIRNPEQQPRSSATDGLRVIEYLHSVKKWR
jgi:predicted dehydrogenase